MRGPRPRKSLLYRLALKTGEMISSAYHNHRDLERIAVTLVLLWCQLPHPAVNTLRD
jgi:hypothetical protein